VSGSTAACDQNSGLLTNLEFGTISPYGVNCVVASNDQGGVNCPQQVPPKTLPTTFTNWREVNTTY
jgi:hypothetical protein